jgi:UPF0716 protein FxsA
VIRFVLLLFPLVEIAAFVAVGREIGVMAVLGLVLLGVVVGSLLIRSTGLNAFRDARAEMDAGRDPGPRIVRSFLHAVAGILFIAPGFVSDAFALVLLLPPVHRHAWNLLKGRLRFAGTRRRPPPRAPVIELQRTDYARRPDPSSPWAKKPEGNA